MENKTIRIDDDGSTIMGKRYELRIGPREFVVHSFKESGVQLGFFTEFSYEEQGDAESGPMGLERIIKHEWVTDIAEDSIKAVMAAITLELFLQETDKGRGCHHCE